MKQLNDYQSQKVQYLKAKLAYSRARFAEAWENNNQQKVAYFQSKIEYALAKLKYMGYEEEAEG
jgi:hypothetical protein